MLVYLWSQQINIVNKIKVKCFTHSQEMSSKLIVNNAVVDI